jgi:protein-tyrosine-phosphatase
VRDGKPVVLFLCVHNAGRSQMALGWFRRLAEDRAVAWSGGSEPGERVNPSAVAVMREVGVDISAELPKTWTDDGVRAAEVVVTMGCGDACPVFPGKRYEDWELDDPTPAAGSSQPPSGPPGRPWPSGPCGPRTGPRWRRSTRTASPPGTPRSRPRCRPGSDGTPRTCRSTGSSPSSTGSSSAGPRSARCPDAASTPASSSTRSTSPGQPAAAASAGSCSTLADSTERAGIWTIQTGIFPENEPSLALHRSAGFRVVGVRERPGQLRGRWRDVVLLERRSAVAGR